MSAAPRLAVLGASGRLGRRLVALAGPAGFDLVAAVVGQGSVHLGVDAGLLAGIAPCGVAVSPAGAGAFDAADVVIDVSLPEGTDEALAWLAGRALVCGVTGRTASQDDRVSSHAASAPLLTATNFSAGVHVLAHLAAEASAALPAYDLEIVELHHRHKRDAPSGTARTLGEAVARARELDFDAVALHGRAGAVGPRTDVEIGVHALRMGDVVGEHEVWIAGEGERLRLGHVATSRDAFARGALRAAHWVLDKAPGTYTMRDVLGLSGYPAPSEAR